MKNLSTRALPLIVAAFLLMIAGCDASGPSAEEINDEGPLLAESESATASKGGAAGYVYTSTNTATNNEVIVFERDADGTLTEAGRYSTGGAGVGQVVGGSQGSVILSDNNRSLFVANAGSNEISVFDVEKGRLTLTDKVASGGEMPVSLTVHNKLLYVLNAAGAGSITGFTIGKRGTLSPIDGSTQPLSGAATTAAPQIGFNPDGHVLVVTERATNIIDTYTVGRDGRASAPTSHPSHGQTPFGFAFGKRNQLIVSEAFAPAGPTPEGSAVSSYTLSSSGELTVISGSVPTLETAACWTVITKNGRFAYVSNTASATISGFQVGSHGTLTRLDGDGITGVTGTVNLELALSNNSRFLYNLAAGTQTISAFAVHSDGSLTDLPNGGASNLPGSTLGLAAR